MSGRYTEAQARAFAEYDAKTFRKILFRLRYDEDADILADYDQAKEHGIKKNEWLREMYDGRGISLKDVSRVLEKYEVDPRIAEYILRELGGK